MILPTMPSQSVVPLWPWILHTNVYVPAWVTVLVIDGPPGSTIGRSPVTSRVPSDNGASPGLISQRSCGAPAVAAGKFQRTVSPTFAVTAAGSHVAGSALTSCVTAGPPVPLPVSAGSVADSVTSTGPV